VRGASSLSDFVKKNTNPLLTLRRGVLRIAASLYQAKAAQFTPGGQEGLVTQPPPSPREMGYYFALAQVGFEMIAPMLVGIGLDYAFGWTPWATVIGLILGFVGGLVHLVHMVNKHDAQERRPPGRAP
jgi:hypothetical protein